MLGLGWSEMLVIAVVVLIVVGPKDLPVMLRNLGRVMGSVRRMSNDFRREIDKAIAADEFKEARKSLSDPLKQTSNDITREFNSLRDGKVEPTGKLKPPESGEESVVDAIHAQAGMSGKGKEATPAATALRAKVSESVARPADAKASSAEHTASLTDANVEPRKVKAAPRKRAASNSSSEGATNVAARPNVSRASKARGSETRSGVTKSPGPKVKPASTKSEKSAAAPKSRTSGTGKSNTPKKKAAEDTAAKED